MKIGIYDKFILNVFKLFEKFHKIIIKSEEKKQLLYLLVRTMRTLSLPIRPVFDLMVMLMSSGSELKNKFRRDVSTVATSPNKCLVNCK